MQGERQLAQNTEGMFPEGGNINPQGALSAPPSNMATKGLEGIQNIGGRTGAGGALGGGGGILQGLVQGSGIGGGVPGVNALVGQGGDEGGGLGGVTPAQAVGNAIGSRFSPNESTDQLRVTRTERPITAAGPLGVVTQLLSAYGVIPPVTIKTLDSLTPQEQQQSLIRTKILRTQLGTELKNLTIGPETNLFDALGPRVSEGYRRLAAGDGQAFADLLAEEGGRLPVGKQNELEDKISALIHGNAVLTRQEKVENLRHRRVLNPIEVRKAEVDAENAKRQGIFDQLAFPERLTQVQLTTDQAIANLEQTDVSTTALREETILRRRADKRAGLTLSESIRLGIKADERADSADVRAGNADKRADLALGESITSQRGADRRAAMVEGRTEAKFVREELEAHLTQRARVKSEIIAPELLKSQIAANQGRALASAVQAAGGSARDITQQDLTIDAARRKAGREINAENAKYGSFWATSGGNPEIPMPKELDSTMSKMLSSAENDGRDVPASLFYAHIMRWADATNTLPVVTDGVLPEDNITKVVQLNGTAGDPNTLDGPLQWLYGVGNGYTNSPFDLSTPQGIVDHADYIRAVQGKFQEYGIGSTFEIVPASKIDEEGNVRKRAQPRFDWLGKSPEEIKALDPNVGAMVVSKFHLEAIEQPRVRQAYRNVLQRFGMLDAAILTLPFEAFEDDGVTPQRLSDGRKYIPNSLGGATDNLKNPDTEFGEPQLLPFAMVGMLQGKTVDAAHLANMSREDRLSIYQTRGTEQSLQLGIAEITEIQDQEIRPGVKLSANSTKAMIELSRIKRSMSQQLIGAQRATERARVAAFATREQNITKEATGIRQRLLGGQ